MTLKTQDWHRLLMSAARGRLSRTPLMDRTSGDLIPFVAAFTDDSNDRRPIDTPLLLSIAGERLPRPEHSMRLDEELWWAAVWNEPTTAAARIRPHGPLVAEPALATLEAETEKELGALHAVSLFTDPVLMRRTSEAARWLIANIQPDNATHRPWAIHVFIRLAADGDMEADLYAQTLLHNASVGARIDIFSAAILLHSALQLAGTQTV